MKKLFRKLHLWLSVPFGIFITLICFSGAMLVFEKEITEWCRPDLYFVKEVKGEPIPMDSLMRKVSATLPDSVSITGVTVSQYEGDAYQVSLSKPRRASMYVDQYTGEIKGKSERLPFFDTMFHLHRWLLGDAQSADGGMSTGKLLVGLSTIMLVIILITGILMWLTNRHKPLRKSLTISVTKGWPRFWHDLHVAGGIYATIFLLAIALTGLTWSFSWYRMGFYGMFGVEASAGGHEGGRAGGGQHGGHGGGERGGHGGHGRNSADFNRDGHAATARTDSTAAVEEKPGRHERPEAIAAKEKPAEKTPAVRPEAESKTEETTATETEEAPRRHGRGGGGWHRHSQDSLGEYAGYHRGDSARGHRRHRDMEESATGEAALQPQREEATAQRPARRPAEGVDGARKRGDRPQGSRDGGERRRGGRGGRHDAQAADTTRAMAMRPERPEPQPFAHWQEVFETLAKQNAGYRQITVSDGSASVVPAGRNSLRSGDKFDFDPYSGRITGSTPYSSQDKSAKVRSAVYTVHVGSWGGMLTRIITFIAVLLGATLPLTGYYLWIRRLWMKRKHGDERKPDGGRK